MKDFYFSMILLWVPFLAVLWVLWHFDRDLHKKDYRKSPRKGLKLLAPAVIALGASNYIGVKYFSLTMFGATVAVSLKMMALGVGLLALYFLLSALLAIWRRISPEE
ncbi:MAG: hypothetical protein ACLQAH_05275 [Limisphaerales bacterium]